MAEARRNLMKMVGLLLTLAVLMQWTALAQVSGESNSSGKTGTYYILGAVQKPGVYQAKGRLSLFELIFMAGGLKEHHGTTAYIMRERKSQSTIPGDKDEGNLRNEVIQVNITTMLKSSAPQYLEPGDDVSIPQEEIFHVAGEVHAPGQFWFKEGMTLRQAISLAQGLTLNANPQGATILRPDRATNNRQEIKVNIQNVMKGKESDIPILPGDIIFVPSARSVKTIPPRMPRDLIPRGPVPPCVKEKPCIV